MNYLASTRCLRNSVILGLILSLTLMGYFFIEGTSEHLPLHTAIEASGSTLAVILALMLLMIDTFHTEGKYTFFGLAFLWMGVLDGAHSILEPGHAFVFFHTIASLSGGIILSLIWVKAIQDFFLRYKYYLIAFSVIDLSALLLLFLSQDNFVPAMLANEHDFSNLALILNAIAGILLLGASVKLLHYYLKSRHADDLIFFMLVSFFGVAELLFPFSALWDFNWWMWHYIRFIGYVLVLYFIAIEIKNQKTLLDHQAHHDSLTGLANRVMFDDRLKRTIAHARREHLKFALLFLDLDNFKDINDTYGHHVGDDILRTVANKLKHAVRAEDSVARLGGDEFTIIMKDIHDPIDVSRLAGKILAAIAQPVTLHEHTFYLNASVGISIYPDNSQHAQDLLRFADIAMYNSKELGKGNFNFYNSALTELALKRVEMEHDIRRAIEADEFEVYYQPQFETVHDSLIGTEALIRWIHPEKGIIPAFQFVPIAEKMGVMSVLDRQVMAKAMRQYVQWYEKGYSPGVLSLNLTMDHLENKNCMSYIYNMLVETGCEPHWLEFEITEGQIMQHPEKSITILEKLASNNIKLSVDDFGTGHSSLVYLKKLPIRKLKIDREFVKDLPKNQEDKTIVKTIIALAHNLGLETIAEGVETQEQKHFLQENGCMNIQGYLYAKPMPSKELENLLAESVKSSVMSDLNWAI